MSVETQRAIYLKWLRKYGDTISYNLDSTAKGAHGVPVATTGLTQVVPARVDEIKREFEVKPYGMLQVGSYAAHVTGDVDIPLGTTVIAKSKTCTAVAVRNDNKGIRNTIFLQVQSQ